MKEIIGQFAVIDKDALRMWVVVSQEMEESEDNVVISSKRIFCLHDMNGEEIKMTEIPNIFLRRDGSFLKKVGPIINC